MILAVYEVSSYMIESEMDGVKNICLGDTINWIATDFTAESSFLHFDWDFSSFGSSTDQQISFYPDQAGQFYVMDLLYINGLSLIEILP